MSRKIFALLAYLALSISALAQEPRPSVAEAEAHTQEYRIVATLYSLRAPVVAPSNASSLEGGLMRTEDFTKALASLESDRRASVERRLTASIAAGETLEINTAAYAYTSQQHAKKRAAAPLQIEGKFTVHVEQTEARAQACQLSFSFEGTRGQSRTTVSSSVPFIPLKMGDTVIYPVNATPELGRKIFFAISIDSAAR